MDIYRKDPIPVIYTELNFVRASKECVLWTIRTTDPICNESSALLLVTIVCQPGKVVSLTIKASFPDDILEPVQLLIKWQYYYWKLWDAETLVEERELPAEAIPLEGTRIDQVFLDSIAQAKSCLPWLRTAQDASNSGDYKGYEISNNTATQIEQYEKSLIARLKLNNIK